jgi:hypothetical protein
LCYRKRRAEPTGKNTPKLVGRTLDADTLDKSARPSKPRHVATLFNTLKSQEAEKEIQKANEIAIPVAAESAVVAIQDPIPKSLCDIPEEVPAETCTPPQDAAPISRRKSEPQQIAPPMYTEGTISAQHGLGRPNFAEENPIPEAPIVQENQPKEPVVEVPIAPALHEGHPLAEKQAPAPEVVLISDEMLAQRATELNKVAESKKKKSKIGPLRGSMRILKLASMMKSWKKRDAQAAVEGMPSGKLGWLSWKKADPVAKPAAESKKEAISSEPKLEPKQEVSPGAPEITLEGAEGLQPTTNIHPAPTS